MNRLNIVSRSVAPGDARVAIDTLPPLGNGASLTGLSTGDTERALIQATPADVVVVGDDFCETRVRAASEIALGTDGASPITPMVRGGASQGDDIPGTDLIVVPGVGTGNSNPGIMEVHVAIRGTHPLGDPDFADVPHALQTGLSVLEAGPDETCIMLRIKRGSTPDFVRVSVGPPDSAAPGYRALMIPN